MQHRITFNGKVYDSVEEMPDDVRAVYLKLMEGLDKDGNGIPDMVEHGGILGKLAHKVLSEVVKREIIHIDGKESAKPEELPPQLREVYEAVKAISDLNAGKQSSSPASSDSKFQTSTSKFGRGATPQVTIQSETNTRFGSTFPSRSSASESSQFLRTGSEAHPGSKIEGMSLGKIVIYLLAGVIVWSLVKHFGLVS